MQGRTRRSRLVVVSNRLPDLGHKSAQVGGLVSAVRPALDASPGALWFGWSGRPVPAGKKPRLRRSRLDRTTLLGLDLQHAVVEGYYEGFCNGSLWPLLHCFPGRLTVSRENYAQYRRANALFARALAKRLAPSDHLWIHDFHLFPLAQELRARGFDGPIGFFLHVPFPPHDILSLLPWSADLLRALDACDLVGFHTAGYAENYRHAARRELGRRARPTVGVYPIGIDPSPHRVWADTADAARRGKRLRRELLDRKLILGVDRLDYTKGIPDRLKAFASLLERHPRWRRRVGFIQISAPSRVRVAEYVRQRREVEELVGHINGRFGDAEWVPIRYLFRAFGQRELATYYREADACLVSPLRDGMNLVAKEYVACQTGDPGVLLLSKFAGAAEDLIEAVSVNPYDIEGTGDALDEALSMSLEERTERQAALLARVERGTAAWWARSFLDDLAAAAGRATPARAASTRGDP